MAVTFITTSSRTEYTSDGTNVFVITNSGLLFNISGAGYSIDFVKSNSSVASNGDWVTISDVGVSIPLLYSETIYPSAAALLAAITALINSGTISATAILDFPNTPAGNSVDLTIPCVGAIDGDPCALGVPNVSMPAAGNVAGFIAWVSAPDVVSVRLWNGNVIAAIDPASGTFKVTVLKN